MAKRSRAPETATAPSDPDLPRIAAELRPLARPLAELREDPKNARRHPEANLAAIRASLAAHGQRKPIVVRAGVVLAGNGTLVAARSLGWSHLAAVEYEGPEAAARAFALADNRSSDQAVYDPDALHAALAAADAAGVLAATGWGDDLARALADAAEAAPRPFSASDAEDPGAGEPPAEPASKLGELYELGPHRLLCGDATDEASCRSLVGDEEIRLVWTDPPYGINYVGGLRPDLAAALRKRTDGKTLRNDALSPETTVDLIRSAYRRAAACSAAGAAIYAAAPPGEPLPAALRAFEDSGFVFRHSLAWVKDAFVLGRCDYHYRHEVILYGWKDGPHYFVSDRTQDSVFEIQRPRQSPEHPTMKPVALVERMVANSSRHNDLVYDPFAGSGTTLIACARLGRLARLVEIDPGYCDVIRRRWTTWAVSAGQPPGPGALPEAFA